MKIAIGSSHNTFGRLWVRYCKSNNIPFKLVDCYSNDILSQIKDCSCFVWQIHQNNEKDIIFAKQLIFSIQKTGIKTFPDFNTIWHFDDKVGQKYLLEAIDAPIVPTWVFYEMEQAIMWAKNAEYPFVFKLRGGASSANVKLVNSYLSAKILIYRAFKFGFSRYDSISSFKERFRKFSIGKTSFFDVVKGFIRIFIKPKYSRIGGYEKGYVYFQKYVPNNKHDIRVIVIGDKAFAIKRFVRSNDFRASGSGFISYEKDLFDNATIELSFSLSERLNTQCVAFDYIYYDGNPLVVEISYGFSPSGYENCPGYWDRDLQWHSGKFDPYGWMLESVI